MATRLADIFIGDYYTSLDPVNSPELTAVYDSGIIARNSALDDIASNGQGTGTIRYWQDLDANEAPNISTDDPAVKGAVGKVTQGTMKARTLYLNKAYAVTDLTSELADSAPMQQIRNRFSVYWTRQWQRYLIGAARGVIASNIANNSGDMVVDAGLDVDADAFIDAAFTAGDAAGQFGAIGVHSAVMKKMAKLDMIEYIKDSEGKIILTTYMGKPVFMDDSLKLNKSQYLSIFFGTGAFGYGVGKPTMPVELERAASSGNGGGMETLWERQTYLLHPAGFKWKGEEDPNKSPTAVDFADAANWTRVFDRKQVPFAAVINGTAPTP